MKRYIIPSLIAKNQKELNQRFKKVKEISKILHIDVMDGKFVENKSNWFNFRLPKNKKYQIHLMVKDPFAWIKKNWRKADLFFFHIKTVKNPKEIISFLKKKKKKVGIALSPESKVIQLKPFLKHINAVLILTVHPGKYGGLFLPRNVKKIKKVKRLNPKIKICVDGSVNPRRIKKEAKVGADMFTVGSYLQNADDVKEAIKRLQNY